MIPGEIELRWRHERCQLLYQFQDELGVAARVSCAAAIDADRDRLIAKIRGADVHLVPGGWA